MRSSLLEELAQAHQRVFVGSADLRQFRTSDLPARSLQTVIVHSTLLHRACEFRSQLFASRGSHSPNPNAFQDPFYVDGVIGFLPVAPGGQTQVFNLRWV